MNSKTPISSEADFEQRAIQIAHAYGTSLCDAFRRDPGGGAFQPDWFTAGKSLCAWLLYMANCDPRFVEAFIHGMRIAIPAGQPCPRCGGPIPNAETPGAFAGALSRVDNETEICSRCGSVEAVGEAVTAAAEAALAGAKADRIAERIAQDMA